MTLVVALALVAAQMASGDGKDMLPATSAAIVAGGRACVGATIDLAGQDARLAGWSDANDGQTAGMKTKGRVMTRDHVMLVVKPGMDGGCVVQAKAAAGFDRTTFLAGLSSAVGTPIGTDPQHPQHSVYDLPNGEVMTVQIGDDAGATFVQLVVANQKGKHAQQTQGN